MLCCGSSNKDNFSCEVLLLDDTVLPFKDNIHFKNSVKTQTIFDAVCDHLNLAEKDYFGLYYQDNNCQTHWLDLYRTFREHEGLLQGESPHKLHFGVKFFIADPTNLREEITRYYYFLQLKQDILSGKLPCDFKKATELSALVVQSELGDYQRKDHGRGYASEFRFVPNQDEEFENEVERLHRGYSGLVPAEAEMIYLRKCRQLDMYGLDIHSVQDESGMEYIIGLSPRGVEVRKNRRKVKTHYWPLISHIEFKDRQLKIQVKNKNCDDSVYTFMTTTRQACKYLWKRAIEHHAFFRLTESSYTSSSIPLLGKKFGYSGRTEKEMQQFQTNREEPAVLRSRSKRYPSRQNKSVQAPQKAEEENEEVSYPNMDEILTKDYQVQNQPRNNEESILEKSGLFGTSENGGNRSNYVTPKNERRQRNRNLRSLSDSENKHRSTRHGRSSGEESDSPSKRRIRARNQRARHRSGTEKDTSNHQQKRHYHTDTEMVGGGHLSIPGHDVGIEGVVTDDGGRSDTRSSQARRRNRKKRNRLSREDVAAQQKLWNHISRDFEDPEKYTQEQLQDIPYTEVKTEGNPLPIRLRRHSRGSNSPKHRRTSTHSSGDKSYRKSSSTVVGDGLVSPLSVTTTVRRDKIALGATSRNNFNMNDWDTKTRSYNNRRYATSTNC